MAKKKSKESIVKTTIKRVLTPHDLPLEFIATRDDMDYYFSMVEQYSTGGIWLGYPLTTEESEKYCKVSNPFDYSILKEKTFVLVLVEMGNLSMADWIFYRNIPQEWENDISD